MLMRGSSPRVRSRRVDVVDDLQARGIISACAEQTTGCTGRTGRRSDHLRVCGADQLGTLAVSPDVGSSPRVRSRLVGRRFARLPHGIISACAEQTSCHGSAWCRTWDHLRVCGADRVRFSFASPIAGSSPRVRSRLAGHMTGITGLGIISACAEQTPTNTGKAWCMWDHLRVCGADFRWS